MTFYTVVFIVVMAMAAAALAFALYALAYGVFHGRKNPELLASQWRQGFADREWERNHRA